MKATLPNRLYANVLKSELANAIWDEMNKISSNPQISKADQAQMSTDYATSADYARLASATGRISKINVFNNYYAFISRVLGAVNTKGKSMVSQAEINAIDDVVLQERCKTIYQYVTGSEVK